MSFLDRNPSPAEIYAENERLAAAEIYAYVEAGWRESRIRAGLDPDTE